MAACSSPAEFDWLIEAEDIHARIERYRSIGIIRDEGFPPSLEEWFNGFKQVRPINYVGGIAPRPLLLVHGNKDEVVGVSHAHRLYERAKEPKQIIVVDGAGHRLRWDNGAMSAVIDWLKYQCQI